MKKNLFKVGLFSLMAFAAIGVKAQEEQLPAFPGAEGHGRYTTGGRGGRVIHVTNLNDSGTGSLRAAVGAAGAKTIVFDVSGTIHLESDLNIRANTTIAGQTSPGGICIADRAVKIGGDNVILRYLTFRPGDRSGQEVDGLGAMDRRNLIVDHCSVSWSVDECLSVYGSHDFTVQWCIASEALRVSAHGKGTHCYGGNWGGDHASYHHNLIAHCESRTPRLGPRPGTQDKEYMDLRNNVFYNWAGNGCYGGEGMKVNIVNNYYKPGPATDTRSENIRKRIAGIGIRTSAYTDHDTDNPNEWDKMWHVWGKFYVDGNYNPDYEDVTNDNWTYGIYNQISNNSGVDFTYTEVTKDTMRLDAPLETDYITTHTAEVAYEKVLAYVGNSLYRDAIDERIISDTRNREATIRVSGNAAGFINSPDVDLKPEDAAADWSPFPELPYDDSRGDITDTDGDGMPDVWENNNGLNPNDAEDGNAVTLSEEGYTNLEVYLNSLVAHITEAQNADGVTDWYEETVDIDETPAPAVANVYAAGGMLHVDGLAAKARIEVYSLAGALVDVEETSSSSWALPLGNGLYVVKVVSDGQAQSFKVIVD